MTDPDRSRFDGASNEPLLDRMTDAFFAVDSDWRFTYLNDHGHEVIREAAVVDDDVDLVGRSIWDVIPDAIDTPFYEQYTAAMDDQETRSFEEYYEPLDTWFEVRAYPSESGLSVYFRDVTERKARETELVERDRVLQEVYHVISEKDTSLDEKVESLLEIGQDVLGTEYAALSHVQGEEYVFEIVRDPAGDTQPGDIVPLSETNCERAIVTERSLVLADVAADAPELTDRAGFTEQGIACYLGTPVFVDDEVYGTFCFYDRTPRAHEFTQWQITLVELMGNWVSYEQERVAHQEALTRERNRLDDFVGVVSHDLRNPLNTALGFLDLAREDHDTEELQRVDTALDRMDELIEDLLTMARTGDEVVDQIEVDFQQLVTTAWQSGGAEAATLDVEDLPDVICGDESRLQQLFENLFRNAIEHAGRDVTVTVGRLQDRRGFYVEDDGPGLPADDPESVLDHGFTTRERGTGFGLSIVGGIVGAHGGTITVTESDTGGARFEILGIEQY